MLRSVAAALACLLAFVPSVNANHVQTDSGNPIVFRSQGGNEWWVQVQVSGQGAGSVATMEAADSGGPWVTMTKHYDWGFGVWAASFHIEPTHPVKFRASWPGGAQQESCWFTHPAGEESCPVPPPPPGATWTATLVGDAGRSHGGTDLAIGRPRGLNEVFLPAPTGLYAFTWTSSGWSRSLVAAGNFDHVAVGDLEGDGTDVVASQYDFSTDVASVDRYRWDGAQWSATHLFSLDTEVAGLSFGDVVDGGRPELYTITGNPRTIERSGYDVFQTTWTGSAHVTVRIATTPNPHEFPQSLGSLWVGDADNDGDRELVVGTREIGDDRVYVLDAASGGGWTVGLVGFPDLGGHVEGVVVGDPDRDGQNEVYAAFVTGSTQDELWRFRHVAGDVWAGQRIVQFASGILLNDLFYADGDSDGQAELYVSTNIGHLYQVVWTGTQWSPRDVADVSGMGGSNDDLDDLVVGDGDNDGKNEVYADGYDFGTCCPAHHLFRIGTAQPPPPPPPGFDATFTGVRGNEWWVQANVAATGGTLAKVDVRLNGGAWQPLAKQSWGGWAASYHIVQGTTVQLRATSTTGATDLSSCYRWIPPSNADAATVPCGSSPPPPPPSGFDATFSGVKGNEWWVQVNVAANQPLAGVDARVNCGTWTPLTHQSWGGWAKSFHVPNGAKVDFRARSTAGASDLSGGYTWPGATPTTAC